MTAVPRRLMSPHHRPATAVLCRITLATIAAITAVMAVASTQPAVDAQPLVYRRVHLTLTDTLGGAVTGVAVDGATGIAYVSRGARVEAWDVTADPTTPKLLATSERRRGVARVLWAVGGYVLVAVRTTSADGITVEALSTLRAFDARDMTPPLPTSGSPIAVSASVRRQTGNVARVERAFAADAAKAYLVGTNAVRKIRIIDLIARPARNEATVSLTADVNGLAVAGATLLAATDEGLTAIDVSDPSKPMVRGAMAFEGGAGAVAVSGPTAYVTAGGGLAVVDIRDAARLALRGPVNTRCGGGRRGAGVVVAGGRAWVKLVHRTPSRAAVHACALEPVDSAPTVEGMASDLRGMAAAGDAVLLAGGRFGLESLTIHAPPDHSTRSQWTLPALGDVGGLSAAGDTVRLMDSDSELWTFGAANPAEPSPLGRIDLWPPAQARSDMYAAGLTVRGSVAFAALISGRSFGGSVAAIDLTPLALPTVLGEWLYNDVPDGRTPDTRIADYPTSEYGPYLSGDTLFVTGESVALTALDVADPAAPRWLGRFTGPDWEHMGAGLALDGTRAWLAMYSQDIGLLDVSDPTAPRLIDRIHVPGAARDAVRVGGHVFVSTVDWTQPAHARGNLVVIDAATRRRVAQLPSDVPGYRLVVDGPRAFLYGDGKIEVVDVRDPTRPVEVGQAWGVVSGGPEVLPLAVVGDTVWAGAGDLGVSIYRLTETEPFTPSPPIRVGAYLPYGAVPRR